MTIQLPDVLEYRINGISDEELEFRGWTRDGMRAGYERRLEADKKSPQPGEPAPDFTLELLSATGTRTGEPLSLSSLRGKPTGLIFGSFT
jgi:hypothetical protein